jgi:aquaporin Z
MTPGIVRKLIAEFVGTAILVFFAVGSAVFGIDKIGVVGVALAFGLTLLALAYAIGPVSGCHVNPAVTMGALASGRISVMDATGYWVAQFVGAIGAAALLKLMTSSFGRCCSPGFWCWSYCWSPAAPARPRSRASPSA